MLQTHGGTQGMRADVVETFADQDKILVGLSVYDANHEHGRTDANRWQALTVEHGKVTDIRGFDDREDAARRMR